MLAEIVHALAGLFAVMNPIGNVPIFLSLTGEATMAQRRKTARQAIVAAFLILFGFLVLGHFIFALFGITVAAFRVAGGILIFGIAYSLLQAKPSHAHTPHDIENTAHEDIAVTPLATPLIAGPGTIATVMALSGGPDILRHTLAVFIAMVAVLAGTYAIFHFSGFIAQRLSQTDLNVVTRLMGLLLAIIAVQMAVSGLDALFPGLLHP